MSPMNSPEVQLPPTRSKVLIGEGSDLAKLAIREFKGGFDLVRGSSPSANSFHLQDRVSVFCRTDPRASISREVIEELDAEVEIDPNFRGSQVLRILQNKLIDPKVVTGDIRELIIADTNRDELPDAMISKFDAALSRSIKTPHLEGQEALYKVFGKLRLGSKMAAVACGVCISPRLRDLRGHRKFDYLTQVERFPQKGLGEDVAAWMDIIEESRTREAGGRLHPLSGGIMNPR